MQPLNGVFLMKSTRLDLQKRSRILSSDACGDISSLIYVSLDSNVKMRPFSVYAMQTSRKNKFLVMHEIRNLHWKSENESLRISGRGCNGDV